MMSIAQNGVRPVSDLENLRVEELGQGEQTIVFLHGLFGSPAHWRGIMEDLADRYRVVAPQFPVDCKPDRRKSGIRSISDLTDYVESVVEQLGLQQAIFCGNSLGGLVAIDFCLRHPRKAEGLVLTGSAGLYENNLLGSQRPRMTRQYVRDRASEILYNQALVTDELVDGIHQDFLDRNYVRFIFRVARATRSRHVRDQLGKLKMPTLIIWGRNDQITPPSVAEQFRDGIENSQLVYLDQCGHAPNLERPEQFSRILQEFLMGELRDRSVTA